MRRNERGAAMANQGRGLAAAKNRAEAAFPLSRHRNPKFLHPVLPIIIWHGHHRYHSLVDRPIDPLVPKSEVRKMFVPHLDGDIMNNANAHITALVGNRGSVRDALSPDALLDRLLAEASRQGLTPGEMSRRTGVDFNTCTKVLHREARRTSWDTVIRLAEALDVRVELFNGKGQSLARSDN